MGNKSQKQARPMANPYPKQVSHVPSAPDASSSHAPPSYAEATAPSFGTVYPDLSARKPAMEPVAQAVICQTYQQAPVNYPPAGYPDQQTYRGHPPYPYGNPQPYGHHPPAAPLPQGPVQGAPTTYVIPKAFDSGARFDGIAKPHIPPPPPGCAPNAAQLALAQGHNVVLGQKKSSVIKGGSNGGYTFW